MPLTGVPKPGANMTSILLSSMALKIFSFNSSCLEEFSQSCHVSLQGSAASKDPASIGDLMLTMGDKSLRSQSGVLRKS